MLASLALVGLIHLMDLFGNQIGGMIVSSAKKVSVAYIPNSLATGSKKRLDGFLRNMTRDRTNIIFDDKLVSVAMKYAYKPNEVIQVRNSLNRIKNQFGEPFSQSIYHYSLFRGQVDGFKGSNHTSFRWNVNYQTAIKELKEEYSKFNLTPLTYYSDADIRNALPKENTHSGWTYIETGFKRKGDNLEAIFAKHLEVEQDAIQLGSFNRPILPGKRIQGSAYDEDGNLLEIAKLKNRMVNMVDLFIIISELRYSKPLQYALGRRPYYAGGKDNNEISTIIHNMRRHFDYYTSLDYSAYDQSLSNWLIEDAFDILKSAFRYVDEGLWKVLVHDFIYKEIVMPEGSVFVEKGVPSGSMFTQIIDSLCNQIMIKTFFNSQQIRGEMIIMGDDNLIYHDKFIEPEEIASYLNKNFGVTVNADKTSYGSRYEYPHFLSREWRIGGQWRHPYVLLQKMMYPERFRVYSNGVTPELVFYSYFLAYQSSMSDFFDMRRFFDDYPYIKTSQYLAMVDMRYMSGFMAYLKDYERR